MSVKDAETAHVDHVQVERAVLPLDSFKSSRELVQLIRDAMAGKYLDLRQGALAVDNTLCASKPRFRGYSYHQCLAETHVRMVCSLWIMYYIDCLYTEHLCHGPFIIHCRPLL